MTRYKFRKGDTKLVMELAKGSKTIYAAKKAGVSEATANRRLRDPLFRAEVSKQRRKALDIAAGILAEASAGAAKVLDKLAQDKKAPGHVRRSAARDVLDHAMRLRENMDLEERMLMIEQKLRELDDG